MGLLLLLAASLLAADAPSPARDAVVRVAVGNLYSAPDEAVDREALLPGDLVFFGVDARNVTHVGLFLGDGRFIDATTHDTPVVGEDRLDDPHWSAIYQGARRPR